MKPRRLLLAAVFALCATSVSQGQGPLIATIVFPGNGAANADLTQPIEWTSVPDAQAYYVYVGTTVGAKDLVNTGELQLTSYQAWNLPIGQTLYLRLWTKVADVWRYVDSTFSASVTLSPVATITYPANGSASADPAQAIRWTSVPNSQAYYLYVGTTPGAQDLLGTGEIQQTSYLATTLPVGQTLYARLWTKVGDTWRYSDTSFTEAPLVPSFTYPSPGATSIDATRPWTWTSVPDVQAYYLYVGTTAGAKDLVDTGEIQQTSYLPVNLPQDSAVYARLWAKVDGSWRYADATFTVTPPIAVITYPLDGTSNADPTQQIQWTPLAAAQAYYLYVGTTIGAKNLVDTSETQSTSYPAINLPSAQLLYARLFTKFGGIWRYADSSFTLAPLVPSFTYPIAGATSIDTTRSWTWTSVPSVQAYYLYVGTTVGANDLVNTGEIHQTTYLPLNLPLDRVLFARLWAKAAGVWRYTDTTFTVTPLTTILTYPPNGAVNADSTQPIRWQSVPGAQAYRLTVGSAPGSSDLVDTGETQATSYVTTSLPLAETLSARIGVELNGVWRYTDSTFSLSPLAATLVYPFDGAVDIDTNQPATWTSVPSAQAYYLYLGSTPGAMDLLDSSEITQTSFPIATIPPGQIVYARLWTEVAGAWRYTDSTFTPAPSGPVFVYPLDGATGVDVTLPFQWTPPANAQAHKLLVGTSPGANDLLDTGEIAATSYVAAGLPSIGTLYARVWSKVNGKWARHSDIAFTVDTLTQSSTMLAPVDGTTTFDGGQPFRWSADPLGRAYRLTIGTTPGGIEVHDSGEIHVTRRFVSGLPIGLPLFGRLQTRIDGQWHATDFVFSVVGNAVSNAAQIDSALWATDFVRSMASADNRPFGWTTLLQGVAPRYNAVCTDYAATLLTVLGEMNVSLNARSLHVALNTNGYDVHTLVELFNPDTQAWMILDPTFDLVAKRLDGGWAAAEDIAAATSSFNWSAISYVFLGAAGDQSARSYYIDYPLLYVNVFHQGQPLIVGQGNSPIPYLQPVSVPVTGSERDYVVRCLESGTVQVIIDGAASDQACNGIDSLAGVFGASSIGTISNQPAFQLYQVPRFVF